MQNEEESYEEDGNFEFVVLVCDGDALQTASLKIPGLSKQASVCGGVKTRLALVHKDDIEHIGDLYYKPPVAAFLVGFGMIEVSAPAWWFRKIDETDLANYAEINWALEKFPRVRQLAGKRYSRKKEEVDEAEEEGEAKT